jgi:hypothetical protein
MYKRLVLVRTLVLLFVPVAALADSMIDFTVPSGITSGATESIGYTGGANPLVSAVTGLPSGTTFNLLPGAVLNFQTGAFSSSTSSSWTFNGAGSSITLNGSVDVDGNPLTPLDDISGTLLSGGFLSGGSVTVTDFGGNFKIAGASFIDTKDPRLLALFGMPSSPLLGNFNIGFTASGSPPSGFASTNVTNSDVINTTPVPEPVTLLLLSTGLLGVGVRGRKRLLDRKDRK